MTCLCSQKKKKKKNHCSDSVKDLDKRERKRNQYRYIWNFFNRGVGSVTRLITGLFRLGCERWMGLLKVGLKAGLFIA